jgi:hypothetical protein
VSRGKSRRQLERERTEFRKMVLRQRPRCEAALPGLCSYRATEVNELQRGPARQDCWLDWDRVTSLCAPCHAWLTHHPSWAVCHGHQLFHERIVTDWDWTRAAELREQFRSNPCTPNCVLDHRW